MNERSLREQKLKKQIRNLRLGIFLILVWILGWWFLPFIFQQIFSQLSEVESLDRLVNTVFTMLLVLLMQSFVSDDLD